MKKLYLLILLLCFGMNAFSQNITWNGTAATITNSVPGCIYGTTYMSLTEKQNCTSLTVSGNIDATDFKSIRDDMSVLAALDLSNTNIITYTGINGTAGSISTTYPDNQVPISALRDIQQSITITLPSSATSIGNEAFYKSSGMTAISIPNSVASIGNSAFYQCEALTAVVLPSSLTDVPDNCFEYCTLLASVTFPQGLQSIKGKSFVRTALTSIQIPSSVTIIHDAAFAGCNQLTTFTFEDIQNSQLNEIRPEAFIECTSLQSISLPLNLIIIRDRVFYNCSSLETIFAYGTDPGSISLGTEVMQNVPVNTCLLRVPDGRLGAYTGTAVWNTFTNVVEGLVRPTVEALYIQPIGLEKARMVGAIANIGDVSSVMAGTTWSTNPIPTVDNDPYVNNVQMTTADKFTMVFDQLSPGTTYYARDFVVNTSTNMNAGITYGDIISFTTPTLDTDTKIATITGMTRGSLESDYILTSSLKNSIQKLIINGTIDVRDFKVMQAEMPSLVAIDLTGATIQSYSSAPSNAIPVKAFQDNDHLHSILFPPTLTSIEEAAFMGCTKLSSVIFPSSLTTIHENAFYGCNSLKTVDLPASLTTLGYKAFAYCSYLSTLKSRRTTPITLSASNYVFDNTPVGTCLLRIPGGTISNYTGAPVWQDFTNIVEGFTPPTLTTQAVSGITTTSGTGNSTIALGDVTPVEYGIVWGTSSNPTIASSRSQQGIPSNGPYTSSITGLTAGTTYYVRSYATNTASNLTAGTTYGNQISFVPSAITVTISAGTTTITGATPGCLFGTTNISGPDKSATTTLILSGTIDSRDFKEIRDNFGNATSIDLSGAAIAAYTGTLGTTSTSNIAYNANTIPSKAFNGRTNITSVAMPNTATAIDAQAFYGCSGLLTTTIPASITSIGSEAYRGCTNLGTIRVLPLTFVNISSSTNVFYSVPTTCLLRVPSALYTSYTGGNQWLSFTNIIAGVTAPTVTTQAPVAVTATSAIGKGNITVMGDATPIQYGFVWSTSSNPTVSLPTKSTQGIPSGTGAYTYDITGLSANTTYYIRSYVTNQSNSTTNAGTVYGDQQTFTTPATTVSISSNVATIAAATAGCLTTETLLTYAQKSSLTKLILSGTINATDFKAIFDDMGLLTNIDLSGATIAAYTGTGGTASTSSMSYAANAIPAKAFFNKTDITSIVLPTSITAIATQAFYGCTKLTTFTIPTSVTSVATEAFYNCTGLTMVYVLPTTLLSLSGSTNVFSSSTISSCTFRVQSSLYSSYLSTSPWSGFTNIASGTTPPTLTTQAVSSVWGYSATANGTITGFGSLTPNQYGVVWSTSPNPTVSLSTRTLMGVPSTPASFSSTMTGLLPNTTYYVRPYATTLSTNIVAGSVYGPPQTFTTLSTTVTSNGSALTVTGATAGCLVGTNTLTSTQISNTTSLTVTGTIDATDFKAMRDMTGLTSIDLTGATIVAYTGTAGTVTGTNTYPANTIPSNAFAGRTNITSVLMPTSATSIGTRAFYGCTGLTSTDILTAVTSIGQEAYSGCTGLNTVKVRPTLPSSISLGATVFTSVPYSTCKLRVASGAKNSYVAASQWSSFVLTVEGFIPPTVTVQAVSSFSGTTATGNGQITTLGDVPPVKYGVIWSTSPNPTIALTTRTQQTTPINTNPFTSNMTGLVAGTTYYVRSYVYNTATTDAAGVTYSPTYTTFYASAATVTYNGNIATVTNASPGCLVSGLITPAYINNVTQINISGSIDATDFKIMRENMPALTIVNLSNATIASYTGTLGTGGTTNITYPANTIPASAFANKARFTSITLPTNCTAIGALAFSNCTGLTSTTIPSFVTTIESAAYNNCTSLTSVSLPSNLASISDQAFLNCTSLTSITIPQTVSYIGSTAFQNCTNLVSISLPSDLTEISPGLFAGCTSLTSITIPPQVNTIGDKAFASSGLTSISIPTQVNGINAQAFADCTQLSSVTFEDPTNSKIEILDKDVFGSCTALHSIQFPSNLKYIGYRCFAKSGLTTFTFVDPTTSRLDVFESDAFRGCTSLRSITFPQNLNGTKDYAFAECTSLDTIYAYPENPDVVGSTNSIFENVPFNTCIVRVPVDRLSNYVAQPVMSSFINMVEGLIPPTVSTLSIKPIGIKLAVDNAELLSLGDVLEVGVGATWSENPNPVFGVDPTYKDAQLNAPSPFGSKIGGLQPGKTYYVRSFALSKSTTNLAAVTYGNEISFKTPTLTINGTTATITDMVASSLRYFVLNDTQINTITSLTISGTIDEEDFATIREMPLLEHLDISNTVILKKGSSTITNTLPTDIFGNLDHLVSVVLPTSLVYIGDAAFAECDNLTSIEIPSSVSSIGIKAFYHCQNLATVTFLGSLEAIGSRAFGDCPSLGTVNNHSVIPLNIITVSDVFANCNFATCKLYVPADAMDDYLTTADWSVFTNIVEGFTPPVVTTVKYDEVTETTADVYGNALLTDAKPENHGIIWCSSTEEPTIEMSTKWENGVLSNSGDFSHQIQNLSAGTSYNTRSFVIRPSTNDAAGVVYGDVLTFTTLPVVGISGSEVTITSAYAGCLSAVGNAYPNIKTTATSLTISGTIDARDFKFMRDHMSVLNTVNLNNATIAAYSGSEGTTSATDYPANTIPEEAFKHRTGLTSVLIPTTATTIGAEAFSGCIGITSIDLTPSVSMLETKAFEGCSSLTLIRAYKTSMVNLSSSMDVFTSVPANTCVLRIAYNTLSSYQNNIQWKPFQNMVEGFVAPTVTQPTISNTTPTSATGNWNVTYEVGDVAPLRNGIVWARKAISTTPLVDNDFTTDLGSPTPTGSYSSLMDNLAPGTTYNVRSYVRYAASNTTIGTVYGDLKEFTTAPTITHTGTVYTIESAYPGCLIDAPNLTASEKSSMTSLTIVGSIDARDFRIMRGMNNLTNIDLKKATIVSYSGPEGTEAANTTYPSNSIPSLAFNSSGFTKIVLPESITSIGPGAFMSCASMDSITIPSLVTAISHDAFNGCTNLGLIKVATTATINMGLTVFANVSTSNCILRVPGGKYNTYSTADQWSNFTKRIEGLESPVVTTAAATNVMDLSATGHGEFTKLGDVNPIDHGVIWSTSANPTFPTLNKTTDGAVSNIGTFASSITGLSANTKYYYRAYAKNTASVSSLEITYGPVQDFTTLSTLTWNGTEATLTNASAGCLVGVSTLTVDQKNAVTKLTYTGNMDARDFKELRSSMPLLENLDLSGANIVAYTGPDGTITGVNSYLANEVPKEALKDNMKIKVLKLPNSATSIARRAVKGCNNIVSFTVPNAVTTIGPMAFYVCTRMTSLTIPNSVTAIQDSAFMGLLVLPSLTLPSALVSIGHSAFSSCAIQNVNIPASVTSIGQYAFSGCSALKTIKSEKSTPISINSNTFFQVPLTTCELRIPNNALSNYTSATSWNGFSKIIEGYTAPVVTTQDVTPGTSYTATGHGEITQLSEFSTVQHGVVWGTSPNPTVSLTSNPTSFTTSLTTQGTPSATGTYNSSITGLQPGTKYYVRAYVRNTANTIEAGTVYGDPKEFTTASLVTYTGTSASISGATGGCLNGSVALDPAHKASVKSLTIAGSIDARDFKVMRDSMPALEEINLSNASIASYSGNLGTNMPVALTSYTINEIPIYAFKNNIKITSVLLPNTITSINNGAFQNCTALVSFAIPNTVSTIGTNAFNACTGLRTLKAPFATPISLTSSLTVFDGINKDSCILRVPSSKKTVYSGASQWGSFTKIVEGFVVPTVVTQSISNRTDVSASVNYTLTDLGDVVPEHYGIVYDTLPYPTVTTGQKSIFGAPSANVNYTTSIASLLPGRKYYVRAFAISPTTNQEAGTTYGDMKNFTTRSTVITNGTTTVTIIGATPGCLVGTSTLTQNQKDNMINLTISGTIDARDFKVIHDNMLALTTINLAQATIAGYVGDSGTIDANVHTYPVNQLPNKAFFGRSSFNSITIPSSTTSIGDHAFSDCSSISSLALPSTITSLGVHSFYNCTSLISITVPSGVTQIVTGTFRGCTSLASVSLPNTVTTLGDNAFFGCSSLQNVSLPSSLTSIGAYTFKNCTGLLSINIPPLVTTMGAESFNNCSLLATIKAEPTTPVNLTNSANVFNTVNKTTCVLRVPLNTISTYQLADKWKDFTNVVEGFSPPQLTVETTTGTTYSTATANGTFINFGDIKPNTCGFVWGITATPTVDDLTCFKNVQSVPASPGSFSYGITGLLPGKTYYLRSYASNTGTAGTTYSSTTTSFTTKAQVIQNGTTVTINGATAGFLIGTGTLDATLKGSIENLTLNGVIDARDFKVMRDNMASLKTLDLSGVTIVSYVGPDGTFSSNSGTSYPANEIPDKAFYTHSNIRVVTFPTTSTSIGSQAFYGCTYLNTINLSSALINIGDHSFQNCTGLTTIDIPATVTTIEDEAFNGCTNLTTIKARPTTPVSLGSINTPFPASIASTCILRVPVGKMTDYQSAAKWSSFTQMLDGFIPPVVNTWPVTWYTATRVNITAQFMDFGDVDPIAQGVVWGTTPNPTISSSTVETMSKVDPGSYVTIDRTVTPGTTYYIRSYVRRAASNIELGTTYGNPVSFTSLPSVVTNGTEVTITSATPGFMLGTKTLASKPTITKLTISGTIDASDFKVMRDSMNALTSIDLQNATIAAYNGTGGTSTGTSYPANTIPEKALNGKTGLITLSIPSSITAIGNEAFSGCTGLTTIKAYPTTPASVSVGTSAFASISTTNCTIRVTSGKWSAYNAVSPWSTFDKIVDGFNAPALTTKNTTAITASTATANSNVSNTGDGVPSKYGFVWATTQNPTLSDSKSILTATVTTGDKTIGITDLTAGTKYYLRAVVINPAKSDAAGATYGNQISFTALPIVTTNGTEVTITSASAGCLLGTATLANKSSITKLTISGTIDASDFKVMRDSMNALTSIDLQNAAIAAYDGTGGTSTGTSYPVNTVPEKALNGKIGLITLSIPSFITAIGNEAFSGCTGLTTIKSYSSTPAFVSVGTSAFASISTTNCTIRVASGKWSAYNAVSPWSTFDRIVDGFTAPALTTKTTTVITASTATANSNVSDTGDGVPSKYGFVWATTQNPTLSDSKSILTATVTTGDKNIGITGLAAGTKYYLRAVVINPAKTDAVGATYGDQVSFTTLPTVATNGTEVTITSATPGFMLGTKTLASKPTITKLTISGTIDASDFKVMRDSMNALTSIDLQNATIAAYNGTGGTSTGTSYPANTIPEKALNGKTGLITLGIPSSITAIGNEAFSGCTGLTTIKAYPSTPASVSVGTSAFASVSTTNCAIRVASGKWSAYNAVSPWSTFTIIVEGFTAPALTTNATTAITSTGATVNGNVSSIGDLAPYKYGFVWDTSINPTISKSNWIQTATVTTGAKNTTLSGLTPGTKYYVRAVVINTAKTDAVGATYGDQVSFTTLPTVSTNGTEVTITSASAGCLLGAATLASKSTITKLTISGTIDASDFKVMRDSMATLTTIDLQNAAIAAYNGTGGTTAATSYPANTVPDKALYGKTILSSFSIPSSITAIGNEAFSGCTGLTTIKAYPSTPASVSIGTSAFASVSTTNCAIRVASGKWSAYNAVSPWSTFSIIVEGFTPPSLVTNAATAITSIGVTINGNVSSIGDLAPYKYGFVWDTSTNPTISKSNSIQTGTVTTGAKNTTLSGLTPGTKYYVRAVVINTAKTDAVGATYGDQVSFTTLPTVATNGTEVTITSATAGFTLGTKTLSSKSTITKLTISGTIDASDFKVMRDSMPALTTIDLQNATIAAYNGTGGTTAATSYPANTISDKAFYGKTILSSFSIPSSITAIGADAFSGCTGLTTIKAYPTTPASVSVGTSAFASVSTTNCTIRVASGKWSAYNAVSPWSTFDRIVEGFTAPALTTKTTTAITASTATANSNVSSIGDGVPSKYGFVWATTQNPTLSDSKSLQTVTVTSGDKAIAITGLTAGTKYYLRAVVINPAKTDAVGATYGDQVSFTALPTVSTNGTEVTITSASPGCLLGAATLTSKSTTTKLTISGTIDASDFKVMRDSMNALTTIDLLNATIAAYNGTGGTTAATSYLANAIPDKAFYNCSRITSVILPTSTQYISTQVFYNCSGLTSISIPASVMSILSDAFSGCSNLANIYAYPSTPSSLTYGTTTFTSVPTSSCVVRVASSKWSAYNAVSPWSDFAKIVDGFTAPSLTTKTVNSITSALATLNSNISGLGDGLPTKYGFVWGTSQNPTLSNSNWTQAGVTLGNKTYSITGLTPGTKYYVRAVVINPAKTESAGATYGNQIEFTTLPTVSITGSQATITAATPGCLLGTSTIANRSAITTLTITGNIDVSDLKVLRDSMPALTTINLSGAVIASYNGTGGTSASSSYPANALPDKAFYNCNGLTSITLPSTITSIGSQSFYGCTGLTGISIPSTVNTIGSEAFSGCSNLTSISIPSGVTTIGSLTFNGCSDLASVTLPNTITSIGDFAFAYCSSLTSFAIPSSVTAIGANAFNTCSGLTSMTVPSSVTSIGIGTFRNCTGLSSISLPTSLTSIPNNAFQNCTSLINVTLPTSITTIGASVFQDCSELRSVNIPANVVSIGPNSFANDSKLATINAYPSNLGNVAVTANLFASAPTSTLLLRVPTGKLSTYKAASNWNSITNIVEGYTSPTLTTQAVTSITGTSAIGHGTITVLGDGTHKRYGVVWGLTPYPTVDLNFKNDIGVPSATGAYNANMTGLSPGTTYYVRAYMTDTASTSAAGTTYGDPLTFTTTAGNNQLTMLTPPVVVLNKLYDGTNTAIVMSVGTFSGILPADVLTLQIYATATYSNTIPGAGKTITVTYSLGGAPSANYTAPASYGTTGQIYKKLTVKAYLESLYNTTNHNMNKCKDLDVQTSSMVDKYANDIVDLVTVELHQSTYSNIAYTYNNLELHQNGTITSPGMSGIALDPTITGNYYITIKSRNHLETASAAVVSFTGNSVNYDFTDAVTKAYETDPSFTPTKLKDGKWVIYTGDSYKSGSYPEINQEDAYEIFNHKSGNIDVYGYLANDLNGDGYVDDDDIYSVLLNKDILLYIP